MFEGSKENSIRIWKLGSILNAFFIGCLPQIVLLFMDFQRGIVNWDFIGIALKPLGIYENNDALFKSRHGNSLFAISTGLFCLCIITLTFFSSIIFKNHGIYCKCFSVICIPCPNNCVNLNSEMYTSSSPPVEFNESNDEQQPKVEEPIFYEKTNDVADPRIHMYLYSNGRPILLKGKKSQPEEIELKQVNFINVRNITTSLILCKTHI